MGESKKHYSPIEGIIAVLDEGTYTGTNKLALLLALIDLAPRTGNRLEISYREIAEYLIELQWGHVQDFQDRPAPKQIAAANKDDAVTLLEIRRLQENTGVNNFHKSKKVCEKTMWESSVKKIVTMLGKNPVPKLQTISKKNFEFLYTYDNNSKSLILFPESKRALIEYGGVLRSLVETRFVRFVSKTNYKQDTFANLEGYLFGAERYMPPTKMRKALYDVQAGKCIYTKKKLNSSVMEADHVLPWSRNPISHIENFIMTSNTLNGSKSNLLPSRDLIENWIGFEISQKSALGQISNEFDWPSDLAVVSRSLKSIYQKIPEGTPTFSSNGVIPINKSNRNAILDLLSFTSGNI
jgi:hypothetical protein